jgi:serine/threonine protein kinase
MGTRSIEVDESASLIAARYRLERKIGTGGMGVVYRATDVVSGAPVAVKVVDRTHTGHPLALAQRFQREIAAVKRLRSPHTVKLLDAGSLADGSHFMVMEYLEGADLHQILIEGGPLPAERAVRFIMQACAALAEAHAHGIVHRDLKPANLFVTRLPDGSECLKVLDFGISKLPQSTMDEMSLTGTGTVLGSPVYMSPEQMTSSRRVDGRADVWALGIVLYQLLSGGFPFEAEALPELCARVLSEAPLALSAQVAVAPGLEAAVMRCLAKDPAERFARVEELAAALAPFAGSAGAAPATVIVALPLAPPVRRPLPLPPPPPTPGVFVEPDLPDPERRSLRIRLIGAAVGLVAGIIYLVATWPHPP